MRYKVGNIVQLDRRRFRGRFKQVKSRVGRIQKTIRIKSHELAHKNLIFYVVEGFYPGYTYRVAGNERVIKYQGLKLLGEDLNLVEDKEAWTVQEASDLLS